MKFIKVTTIIIIFLFSGMGVLSAQADGSNKLPKAFQIGEYESGYGNLIKLYPESLLTTSKDSLELAYVNWMYLLYDMEQHSKSINVDLKGLKIWLNVFWNKNGSIDYITFYPKPNSRNMDFNKLTAFFIDFVNNYNVRIKGKDNFSHFGSARFPSFAEKYIPKESR
jgi:hypothetical protein